MGLWSVSGLTSEKLLTVEIQQGTMKYFLFCQLRKEAAAPWEEEARVSLEGRKETGLCQEKSKYRLRGHVIFLLFNMQ